ncbi:GNAT family N-acetyltransferase [Nocardia vinacea]|uniref:GNAT family N-acetyltransferase n=1 Tax=Nocardia vinacea TaxID=96468 RepID=UPI000595382B|nr:GNAT family N-acetyltransferase [Nocardia vinacea]
MASPLPISATAYYSDRALAELLRKSAGKILDVPYDLGKRIVRMCPTAEVGRKRLVFAGATNPLPLTGVALPGLRILELDINRLADLTQLLAVALPPEHPDHQGNALRATSHLTELLSGEIVGPLHDASSIVIDRNGDVVAAFVANLRDSVPELSGIWLAYLLRHPRLRGSGVGTWCMNEGLKSLRTRGFPAIRFAVSADNPGPASLFLSLGFEPSSRRWTVRIP